jgi:hypothetical protein
MNPLFAICLAAGALILSGARTSAEPIDLTRFKCADFLSTDREDAEHLLAWLDAYRTSEDDPLIIDFEKLEASAKKLSEFCAAHSQRWRSTSARTIAG